MDGTSGFSYAMRPYLPLELQRPCEVHVVAHALGLAAEHGRMRAEALLELLARQQVDPQDLQH
jgi:hypothetical protein